MKKTILAAILCLNGLTALAQSARTVLDRTAARITQSGCIRAKFNATAFSGTTEQGSTSGTLILEGRKFYMETPDMLTWFDGTTQWTKLANNNEVNVAEPTEEEQEAINPYTLINIYKKGYSLSVTNTETGVVWQSSPFSLISRSHLLPSPSPQTNTPMSNT